MLHSFSLKEHRLLQFAGGAEQPDAKPEVAEQKPEAKEEESDNPAAMKKRAEKLITDVLSLQKILKDAVGEKKDDQKDHVDEQVEAVFKELESIKTKMAQGIELNTADLEALYTKAEAILAGVKKDIDAEKKTKQGKEVVGSGEVEKEGSRIPGTPETSEEGSGEGKGEKGKETEKKPKKEPETQGELLEQKMQDCMNVLNNPKSTDKERLQAGIGLILHGCSWLRGEFDQTNGNALAKKGQDTKEAAEKQKEKEKGNEAQKRVIEELRKSEEPKGGTLEQKMTELAKKKAESVKTNEQVLAANNTEIPRLEEVVKNREGEVRGLEAKMKDLQEGEAKTSIQNEITEKQNAIKDAKAQIDALKAETKTVTENTVKLKEDLAVLKTLKEKMDTVGKALAMALESMGVKNQKFTMEIRDGKFTVVLENVQDPLKANLKEAGIETDDKNVAVIDLENQKLWDDIRNYLESGTTAPAGQKPTETKTPETLAQNDDAALYKGILDSFVMQKLNLSNNPNKARITSCIQIEQKDGKFALTFDAKAYDTVIGEMKTNMAQNGMTKKVIELATGKDATAQNLSLNIDNANGVRNIFVDLIKMQDVRTGKMAITLDETQMKSLTRSIQNLKA